ncbi:MAG TPA: c-type cytochrome [Wenzhouxiangella sp.]|nr:c-type cytochrome [Wenzhouxiangella sp.]
MTHDDRGGKRLSLWGRAAATIVVPAAAYVALISLPVLTVEKADSGRHAADSSLQQSRTDPPSAKMQPDSAANLTGNATDAETSAGQMDLAAGKALYKQACIACHETGVADAPRLGDAAAWRGRIASGMDAMMEIVINGKGAMPPRGASSASDDELQDAVLYMISKVDEDFVEKRRRR